LQLIRHWLGGKDKLDFLFKEQHDAEEGDNVEPLAPPKNFEVTNVALQTVFQWIQEIHGLFALVSLQLFS
jgi:hypothetical protein